ncbi:MAG TPA: EpsD family peptidyl-prolyl cis-trans isomerase [Burkholderiaceae bacterium]|nr:EpsD family peptidyl-prolyl cis-trans isomerase [Burkholderiaceae bacterium]
MNRSLPSRGRIPALAWACAGLAAVALLAGCGDKKDKPATQTAAKVNKEEITVHQINAVLAQQRGLRPEQAEEAGKRALERLIDQELAVQKAAEKKVDRDPRVVQAIEAARREIIARAYADKIAEGAPKPSAEEIKKYYDEHPALFSQRRVYQLQELAIQAPEDKLAEIGARLKSAKTIKDFVDYLKASNIQFVGNQAVRAAEQIPLSLLPELAKLKDGQALMTPNPKGVNVVFLAASRPQPVDEVRATKAIEAFLLNERKRKLLADDLKALRSAAAIEYVGKYAAGAPAPEVYKAPTPAEVAASAAATLDSKSITEGLGLKGSAGAAAASAVEAADAGVQAASGVDASTMTKGLGIKK